MGRMWIGASASFVGPSFADGFVRHSVAGSPPVAQEYPLFSDIEVRPGASIRGEFVSESERD